MTDTNDPDAAPVTGDSSLEVHKDGVSVDANGVSGNGTAGHGPSLVLGIQTQLVKSMTRIGGMSSVSNRDLLREYLSTQYTALDLRDHYQSRSFCFEVVTRCSQMNAGWAGLAAGLEMLADGDPACIESLQLIEQLTALSIEPRLETVWHKLKESLDRIPVKDVQPLVLDVTDGRAGVLPYETTWATFIHLVGLNGRPHDPIPPWVAFLEVVRERFSDGATEAESRDLVRHLAQSWDSTDELERTRARHDASPPRLTRTGVLTLVLTPDAADLDAFTLHSVQRWDGDASAPVRGPDVAARRDSLTAEVERLVARAEEAWAAQPADLRIEFVLPLSLINEPVEWWPKDSELAPPTTLALYHQVVLRSYERMRKPSWHRVWLNRWERLQESTSPRTLWIADMDPPRKDRADLVEAELCSDADYVAVVLSHPPGPENTQEIVVALRAGIPVIVWHREQDDPVAVKEAVGQLMSNLRAVPEAVKRAREQTARRPPAERGAPSMRDVSLLWDNAHPAARVSLGGSPTESVS